MIHSICSSIKTAAMAVLLVLCSFQQEVNKPHRARFSSNSGDRYDLIHAGSGLSTRGLPVYVGVEQTVDHHLSAALMASFQSYGENGSAGSWTHQYYGIGLQGNYHFIELAPDDFDLFAGLTLGWYAHRYKWAGVGAAPGNYGGNAIGGFQLAGQLGARYEPRRLDHHGPTQRRAVAERVPRRPQLPPLMRLRFILTSSCLPLASCWHKKGINMA